MKQARIYKNRIVVPSEAELSPDFLREVVNLHRNQLAPKYRRLTGMYEGKYDILKQKKKSAFKPDNRLVNNFAKYITDTFNGYFMGIPVKVSHPEETIDAYLQFINKYNDIDDENSEISKQCDINGVGVELLYIDEDAQVGVTHTDPEEAFVVYDDSILHRPLYGIRYYRNINNQLEGTVSDAREVHYFNENYTITETTPHYFGDIPIIEYSENEERIGLFETVETLINAYNKALSEKANDVDYFADAYMKILGKILDTDTIQKLRDNRIINMAGSGVDGLTVEFMEKPNGDETQEHLLDRIEKNIFKLSMVADISEEEFGSSSGVALSYKLLPMSNLAKTKERKFQQGLNTRYRLIANVPTSRMNEDDWLKLNFTFSRNLPSNIKEEAETAQSLAGITSKETQLSVISIVSNPKEELQRIEEEEGLGEPYFEERTPGGEVQ